MYAGATPHMIICSDSYTSNRGNLLYEAFPVDTEGIEISVINNIHKLASTTFVDPEM